ncbi:MAG: TonB-dependent receptor [Zoogloea sp.]|uniref:TonB-dependent receptor domain-containing protein n=1 Tax=Zoogloea sp. TaxID=49181 RepID=UPI0026244FB2|nr:TonB-dependent receptor [Zoogloea sp.]MDD3326126.1 TonB-dependent receptor [Zoogloea sp.]
MTFIRPTLVALAVALAFPAPGLTAEAEQPTLIVTASRQAQRADEALADVTVIERDQIEQAGASFGLTELLARQPGIQMASNGGPGKTASIFMRGGNGNHTILLVDGMRVGSATTGTASWQDIPLSQIERIEIVRGPASALYGADAMSGVIQIFTRKGSGEPRVDAFAGAGSYGARELSAGVSGSSEGLSYALRGGYTETAGRSAKQPKATGYNPDDDLYRNSSLSGRLGYRVADGHELGASFLATEGRSYYDGEAGFNNYNNSAQRIWSVHSRNRLASIWTSTLRFGQSVDSYEGFTRSKPAGSTIRTTQDQFVWQHDIRLPLGSLMAAYENLHQKVLSEGAFDGGRSVNSALLGWTAGLGDHKLQLNARHDENSQYGGKTTGYAGYGYQILPGLRFTGSIGSAFRAPTFNELYYPGFGNPDLRPENAYNKEIGLQWERGGSFVSLTAFRNRISDMIVTFRNPVTGRSLPSNVREAQIQGLSLAGSTRLAGFEVEAGVDFLDAKDRDSDASLPRRARQSGHFRISRSIERLTAGVELQGVGGRYDAVSYNTRNLALATERDRLGGYGLVNAFVKYAVTRDWSLEGRANNLLDKQYETAWGYNTPGANVFFGVRYAPR